MGRQNTSRYRSIGSSKSYIAFIFKGCKLLTRPEEEFLWKIIKGDGSKSEKKRAKTKIVESYLKLAYGCARRLGKNYTDEEDLNDTISAAVVGLVKAFSKFDTERGVLFSTYARWHIKSEIQTHLLNMKYLVKVGTTTVKKRAFFSLNFFLAKYCVTTDHIPEDILPLIAKELELKPEEVLKIHAYLQRAYSLNATIGNDVDTTYQDYLKDPSESVEDRLIEEGENRRLIEWVESVVSQFTDREQDIFWSRYYYEDERPTLKELGKKYRVCKERIRQLEAKVLKKLKREKRKFSLV